MGSTYNLAATAFQDFIVPGVPGSGALKPNKALIRGAFADADSRLGSLETTVTANSGFITALQQGSTALTARVGVLENGQASASRAYATWAALSAVNGSNAGDRAQVIGDSGTHTDPVTGTASMPNSGIYGWSTSPAGWRWLGTAPIAIYPTTGAASTDGRAYTASSGVTVYPTGGIFSWTCPVTNVAAATLNLGSGVKSLTDSVGATLTKGLIQAGQTYLLYASPTGYQLQGCVTAAATGAEPFYSLANMQPYVTVARDANASAQADSNSTMYQYMDQFVPYSLTTSKPYYLNGGDNLRPIYVLAAGAYIDCEYMLIGSCVEIAVGTSATYGVTLHCGPGNVWRGTSNNAITFGASAVIEVRRYGATDFQLSSRTPFPGVAAVAPTGAVANLPVRAASGIGCGQSNGVKLTTGGGLAGLQERFAEMAIDTPYIIQAAVGESALIRANAATPTNYWWDPNDTTYSSGGSPGPNATAWVALVKAAIQAGQAMPQFMWWNQGEAEVAAFQAGTTTHAQYMASLTALFGYFRAVNVGSPASGGALPNLTIIVCPQGADDTTNDIGKTAVRDAQLAYLAHDTNAVQGPERYDCSRPYVNVHSDLAGQRLEGRRMATVIANACYGKAYDLGPTVVGVTQSTTGQATTTFVVSIKPYTTASGSNSLSPQTNPVTVVGMAILPAGPVLPSTVPYAIKSITRAFNASTGNHDFTIVTVANADGARFQYPYGCLGVLARTLRFLYGTLSGNVLRSYTSLT